MNRIFLSLSPYDDLQQDTCIQFTTHLKHKLTFVEGWIDGHSAQSSVNPPHHCVLFGDTATEYLWMSDSLPRVICTYILFDDDRCIALVVTYHESSRTPILLQDIHQLLLIVWEKGNWGACLLVSQVFKVPSNFKSSKTFNSFLHTKVWWKEYKRDIQMNESLNFGSFWLRKCFSWASICESAKYNCGHILIGSMSFQKSNSCDPALWPFQ